MRVELISLEEAFGPWSDLRQTSFDYARNIDHDYGLAAQLFEMTQVRTPSSSRRPSECRVLVAEEDGKVEAVIPLIRRAQGDNGPDAPWITLNELWVSPVRPMCHPALFTELLPHMPAVAFDELAFDYCIPNANKVGVIGRANVIDLTVADYMESLTADKRRNARQVMAKNHDLTFKRGYDEAAFKALEPLHLKYWRDVKKDSVLDRWAMDKAMFVRARELGVLRELVAYEGDTPIAYNIAVDKGRGRIVDYVCMWDYHRAGSRNVGFHMIYENIAWSRADKFESYDLLADPCSVETWPYKRKFVNAEFTSTAIISVERIPTIDPLIKPPYHVRSTRQWVQPPEQP